MFLTGHGHFCTYTAHNRVITLGVNGPGSVIGTEIRIMGTIDSNVKTSRQNHETHFDPGPSSAKYDDSISAVPFL